MKDKDKQVEEIAKIANFTAFDYKQGTIQSKTIYTAIAEAIYKYITENLVVLSREEYDKLLDANFGVMTSPIGDLEINPKGMHKAVDEIVRLNRVESELQDLNAKYYNEAKDLRRKMAKIRANAYSKEELEYEIQQANKKMVEKIVRLLADYKEYDYESISYKDWCVPHMIIKKIAQYAGIDINTLNDKPSEKPLVFNGVKIKG